MELDRYIRKLGAFALVGLIALGAESAVKSPEERQSKIELAERLLDGNVELADKSLLAELGNPFSALVVKIVVEEVVVEIVEETLSPQELIPLLANNVKPIGIIAVGGEYYLLLKNSRVKAGDSVPVTYQDVEYNLEIVNVLRSGYALGFEGAEVEIKLK